MKAVQATFIVNSVNEFKNYLLQKGALVIEEPKEVPAGINMTVKHPDGTFVEYVELK